VAKAAAQARQAASKRERPEKQGNNAIPALTTTARTIKSCDEQSAAGGDGQSRRRAFSGKQLQSKVYGYSFNYRTYKPTAYQAGKPAALMIFQDGGNYTGNFKAPRVFDNVIKDGSVPVTISVYIDPAADRSKEYDTRSAKYGMMLTTELIPSCSRPSTSSTIRTAGPSVATARAALAPSTSLGSFRPCSTRS